MSWLLISVLLALLALTFGVVFLCIRCLLPFYIQKVEIVMGFIAFCFFHVRLGLSYGRVVSCPNRIKPGLRHCVATRTEKE